MDKCKYKNAEGVLDSEGNIILPTICQDVEIYQESIFYKIDGVEHELKMNTFSFIQFFDISQIKGDISVDDLYTIYKGYCSVNNIRCDELPRFRWALKSLRCGVKSNMTSKGELQKAQRATRWLYNKESLAPSEEMTKILNISNSTLSVLINNYKGA